MITFQNIHHHDSYSLRSGLGDMNDLVKKAKEYNQKYLGITNYNELSGWVKQYFTCKKNDIVPILGVQMMTSNYKVIYKEDNSKEIEKVLFCGVNTQKEMQVNSMTTDEKVAVGVNWHLLLYAHDLDGYYNLIKIHNDAQINGVYEFPRTNNYELSKHSKGIYCVIPSVNGEIINDIDNGREKYALAKYKAYKNIFEEVYLEVMIAEDDDYIEINNKVISFCKKYNIPMLIGINSHYIEPNEEDSLNALLSIYKHGDKKPEINLCHDMSFKNTEQVYELFERKFKNDIFTFEIFEECMKSLNEFCEKFTTLELDTSIKMPSYNNAAKVLEEKSFEGLRNRGKGEDPIYIQRLKYELDNVIRAGFADYFLFLEDVCTYCKNNKIAIGIGRGSGGGSLVLYVLGIFDVDPVKYNLLFERFLDASRLDEIINQGGQVSGCFPLDTIVKTSTGFKKIGDIEIGDDIITRTNEVKKVVNIYDYNLSEILRISYGEWYFECTFFHEILVKRNEQIIYIHAHELQVGDYLVENEKENKFIKVREVKNVGFAECVRDLEIEEDHNYRICGKPINEVIFKDGTSAFLTNEEIKLLI